MPWGSYMVFFGGGLEGCRPWISYECVLQGLSIVINPLRAPHRNPVRAIQAPMIKPSSLKPKPEVETSQRVPSLGLSLDSRDRASAV